MKILLIFVHILLLICAYTPFLNQWLTPAQFAYGNSFALAFPVFIIIHFVFIFVWFLYKWPIAFIILLLSVPLMILIKPWFPFTNSKQEGASDFSLITYNVKYFYDDYEGIKNFMVKKQPTVVFFQEMGGDPEGIVEAIGNKDSYFFENYNSLGIASQYPIIESNKLRYKKYPICAVYGDVAMPQDTVRFINVYLESLHLDQKHIKNTKANTSEVSHKSKLLISKVAKATKVHHEQIQLIQELIQHSPHPVVLGGDLNALPTSYEYYQMSNLLNDSFVEAGHQIGHTFRSLKVPLKLDYIFTSQDVETVSYDIIPVKYSDHYPTWASFKLP